MSKRARRLRLGPTNIIEIRHGLAERERADLEEAGDWGTWFQQAMRKAWSAADSLDAAPAWWVSLDMTQLAVAAAADGMPDTVLPGTMTGFVAFERDLPEDCAPGLGFAVRAIHWTAERAGGDSFRIGLQYFTADRGLLRDRGEKRLPLAHLRIEAPEGAPIRLASVIRAVWALSAEPRVCEVSEIAAPIIPSGWSPPDPMARKVKVLTLRENRKSPFSSDGDGPAREYSHRFIVRGFWRNQPCGPHNSERRLQWIPPFVKGPADKPLVVRETVRVWRR